MVDMELSIQELSMWKNNARYEHVLDTERECIEKLFQERPGVIKMKKLLDSVILEKGFRETLIVYKNEKKKMIVLDGNRRFSLLKLYKYPDLIDKYQIQRDKLTIISKIENIRCQVYEDLDKAYDHVESRHQGQQGGEGIVPWDTSGKQRMEEIRGGKSKSIGYHIINAFKQSEDPEHHFVSRNIKNESTINRIVSSKYISSSIFHLKNSRGYDVANKIHMDKLNEIFKLFYSKDPSGNVGLVYKTADIKSLFSQIKPIELDPKVMPYQEPLFLEPTESPVNRTWDNEIEKKNIASNQEELEQQGGMRRNNSYSHKNLQIFDWRSKNLIISDNVFKYYLEQLTSFQVASDSKGTKKFIFQLAPVYYRIMLDIAIKNYCEFITKEDNKIKFNALQQQEINTFNSQEGVSMVSANKIEGVIECSKKIKDKNKKKEVKKLIKVLNRTGVGKGNGRTRFVLDLCSVVHGSQSEINIETLQRYDTATLKILQIISLIVR